MHNLQLLAKVLDVNLEVLTGNKEEDGNLEILTASQVKIFADITNMMTKIVIEQNINLSAGNLMVLIKEAYEYHQRMEQEHERQINNNININY